MDFVRQELQQFASATENLLGHGVTLEELNETERDLVHHYLLAMAQRFVAVQASKESQKPIGTA